jgi:hypothetical protein
MSYLNSKIEFIFFSKFIQKNKTYLDLIKHYEIHKSSLSKPSQIRKIKLNTPHNH